MPLINKTSTVTYQFKFNSVFAQAISKMKLGKAAGPSGIVVEMIKAAGDTDAIMILLLRLSVMARSQLTGSKVSVSAFTRARVMLWTEATIGGSS